MVLSPEHKNGIDDWREKQDEYQLCGIRQVHKQDPTFLKISKGPRYHWDNLAHLPISKVIYKRQQAT